MCIGDGGVRREEGLVGAFEAFLSNGESALGQTNRFDSLRHCSSGLLIFFFFQAEDGIRDRNVTGVQTCALPIFLFPALCGGGCLHLVSAECVSDPEAWAAYCHAEQIDCLKIVPSHLAALLAGSRPEQGLPRQCLVLGGEACPWPLLERLQRLAPQCRIFNHYGPTETTVGVLTYPVAPGE